jgi:hypothetical protein
MLTFVIGKSFTRLRMYTWVHLQNYGSVSVARLFRFVFLFLFYFVLFWVLPNVPCVSGLSIIDCRSGFSNVYFHSYPFLLSLQIILINYSSQKASYSF